MEFGGVCDGCFSTPFNTMGIGDPVPANGNNLGSGDLFVTNKKTKPATKKAANDMLSKL